MSRRGSASLAAPSFAIARDPLPTDDSTSGAIAGSIFLNTSTLAEFICLDATASAAVWIQVGVAHPGMRSGRSYPTTSAILNTGTAISAVDTWYGYCFFWPQRATISAIRGRVVTGGAGSSMKAGIWRSKNGLPFGAPVVADNVGASTATTSTNADCAVTGIINPGWNWVLAKFTGTLPTMLTVSSTDATHEQLIGRSNVAGNTYLTGLSLAGAYASAAPTFDGSEAWADVSTNGVPAMRLVVA